ncbi:DNA-binding protein RFX2 isoform X3 [Topomyia yanbarensis]|uniref:DNA-binding protein RFX2 isoform X3 n=1 Tax=Topomyia yanbarensis TaxID=2498891 RepID=UPI00273CF216|nr:DNA-binding protein RFX2 isoform X3 [Topomyia yanbarensis]
MATRLATQRSFITVTPIASTPAVSTPSNTSPNQPSAASEPMHDDAAEPIASSPSAATTPTATITIADSIVGSSTLKNGTGKTVSIGATSAASTNNQPVIPTSLIANNLSLANLLGTQNGALTLQQIIQQKKILIHPNGTVIDIVPIEENDSSEDTKIGVQLTAADGEPATTSNGANGGGQQHVTAQVAVVQAQSPTDGGPQYITVTAATDPEADDEDVRSYASLTAVDVSSPDNVQNHHTYVQYVDSDMYTATAQGQTQMTYPVYTVGDYSSAGNQQYYATGSGGNSTGVSGSTGNGGNTGGNTGNSSAGNGNYSASAGANSSHSSAGGTGGNGGSSNNAATGTGGNNQQYIVPVDEATLLGTGATNGTHQRESPQTMTDVASYLQSHQASHHSNSTTPTPDVDSTPSLNHATRVSPATVAWLVENYENAEGVSLPRSTLYNHYMRHCNENKLDAVNAASFGKLIRSVFTGLRTRRLGTRGNSKYHYYGIRIKPGSVLNTMDDGKPMNASHMNNNNSHSQNHNAMIGAGNGGGGGHAMNHRGMKKGIMKNEIPESCAQYLGDASSAIPQFPLISLNHPFPEEITLEDVDTLRSIYREHCEAFLDAILNLDFNTIESLWREFWRAENNNNGDECEEEKYLSKSKLYVLTQCAAIQDFIKQVDFMFYQNMVEVLIPDVLRPIPTGLTQAIRNFAKNLENWLSSAMSGCPEQIVTIKLSAVAAFGQTLRRYTSLNHLAQAARAVLQNSTQIAQMLNDLNRVDFRNVQEQASWICQCDTGTVQRLENDFKAALQQQNTLEQWASWLRAVVDDALEEYRGKPSFVSAARQFLLKWSFYSSMVIRDLTLRSAGSFGSFHLIRLLYDEYMFFIIEHKVAEATQTTPIAVMGEKDHTRQQQQHAHQPQHQQQNQHANQQQPEDMTSMLYTSDFEVVNVKLEPSAKRMRS